MTEKQRLRTTDMRLIDDIFDMGGGYVLDFSNRTFSEFFYDELDVDIDHPRYEIEGTSKAKRLRCYLRQSDSEETIRVLKALWEYRESNRRRNGAVEDQPHARDEFLRLITRLGGEPPENIEPAPSENRQEALDETSARELHDILVQLHELDPQSRGFGFERFLQRLFNLNGLSARASFRLVGEQIDGSFELSGETYLLEAKWTNQQTGAADLRSFNGKVEDKAAWSRGLFVSDSGFTEDGLKAFGKGKRVVCMDGLDISEMLRRRLLLADVLARKVRRAAETGRPFVRVRELF